MLHAYTRSYIHTYKHAHIQTCTHTYSHTSLISCHYVGGAQHFLRNAPVLPDKKLAKSAAEGMAAMISAGRKLAVTTWNIAAINNNPFEYWITYNEEPKYEELMVKVEQFLENPGDKDVPVSQVFTETMFSDLDNRLQKVGWVSVRSYWEGTCC